MWKSRRGYLEKVHHRGNLKPRGFSKANPRANLGEVEPLDIGWSGGGVGEGHGADAGQALHLCYGRLRNICRDVIPTYLNIRQGGHVRDEHLGLTKN